MELCLDHTNRVRKLYRQFDLLARERHDKDPHTFVVRAGSTHLRGRIVLDVLPDKVLCELLDKVLCELFLVAVQQLQALFGQTAGGVMLRKAREEQQVERTGVTLALSRLLAQITRKKESICFSCAGESASPVRICFSCAGSTPASSSRDVHLQQPSGARL